MLTMTKIHCRNLISAAASFYKAAISVTSGLSSPLNNLAVIYKQQVVFFRSSRLIIFLLVDNNFSVLIIEQFLEHSHPFLLFVSLTLLVCICPRETMLILLHVTLKYFVQILQQLMHQLIEGIHSRRLVELMKQFRIIFRLHGSDQTWQKPMPTWPQLTRIGTLQISNLCSIMHSVSGIFSVFCSINIVTCNLSAVGTQRQL